MNRILFKHIKLHFLLIVFILMCNNSLKAQDFVLREHLGRNWTHELVTFPLNAAQLVAVKQGAQVVGANNDVLPSQLMEGTGQPRLAFQVTLPAGVTQAYKLDKTKKALVADIKVEETQDRLQLGNEHIGIAIRKKLQGNEAPIAGIRLRSNALTAGSTRSGGAEIAKYSVEVTARGPVFAEAVCQVTFADQGRWSLSFRILRGEPVVLVKESFDAPGGGLIKVPLTGPAFQPTDLVYRKGMGNLGQYDAWKIASGRVFALEPWLHWWVSERQGNWFAMHNAKDMLMMAAITPSEWKDPEWKGKAEQPALMIPIANDKDGLVAEMSLGGGSRKWMLGTPLYQESVAPLTGKNLRIAPLPQRYLIKHGDFPLDLVKDYVLDWNGDHDNYPRLFIGKSELPKLRAQLKNDPAEVKRWISDQPIDKYNIDSPLNTYFASQNPQLEKAILAKNTEWLQLVVDDFLEQNNRVTLGVAPHMQSVFLLPTINLTDAMLGAPGVTAEQRKQMLAKIAFLGYAVNRDDYWSPSRGFAANPNMTTTVALYQTALASLVPSHPLAKAWAERGLTELRRQLFSWSDEDGGWLETPHYAMVALDHMIGAFLMAKNAGFGDYLHEERIRKVCEWLAKISTPRDRRTGGFRHYPPIGNTYMGEGTSMFGIIAGLWKERDPAFASQMQWMCDEHGSPPIGLFGPFGTFSGYKAMLKAHGVVPKAPQYGSEWFRNTGVVLRNTIGSERETYLHLIAGSQHDHYDFDSGSIVIWGKGQLLADDFGYIGRHAAQWHSMLTSSAVNSDSNMVIDTFSPSKALDYVSGKKGPWQRQIAFMKDADPMGPTGFLIRDNHDADEEAIWRLWLMAKKITLHAQGATIEGEDDVDLDVYFFDAGKLGLKTEATVQKGMGRRDKKEGPIELPQTALVATLKGRGSISAFLYPRLKTEAVPKVSWFAKGAGVQIETATGTDYLFLNNSKEEGKSPDGKAGFQCQSGSIQLRNKATTMTLGTAGKVIYGGRVLESAKATSQITPR